MSTSPIHPVTMPKWGLEMTEGTVTGWKLAEGDKVSKGVELADIETAKIVNTIEADREGTIRKLVAQPGDTLPVGALIAVIGDAGVPAAEIDRFVREYKPEVPIGDEPIGETSAPAPVAVPAAAAPTGAELEARNAEAHATPIARRVANKLGIDLSTVTGTGPKGRISQEDVEKAAGNAPAAAPPAAAAAAPAPVVAAAPPPRPADLEQRNATAYASPIALRLANRLGVDLTKVSGTGPKNRISQEDVEQAAAAQGLIQPAPSPETAPAQAALASPAKIVAGAAVTADAPPPPAAPASGFDLVPHSAMRKAIAAALVKAKQTIPHFYLTIDLEMDRLLDLRKGVNAERSAGKFSLNDFILRATALALKASPDANVHFTDEGVKRFRQVDLCVAVAIEGGLVTPVIRDAGNISLEAISRATADLAKRARARTLKSEDLSGGTFTVSNLGMFGIRQFEAIINPPQGGILAIGNVRREAYETGSGIGFRSVTSVTLSCDHRVIDGAVGAGFLAELKKRIEQPWTLLA
jgi:pyruvate dehydrogenase E2 component (dihydrolipoamide acetyltransferase)